MSLRRFLVLSLTSAFPVVVGLVAYLALTWPYPPPHYDGKEPFALRIHGMRGIKMYLDPRDSVITPTILSTGSWEADETAWFLRYLTIRIGYLGMSYTTVIDKPGAHSAEPPGANSITPGSRKRLSWWPQPLSTLDP
jgi:hypothetical protein